MFPLQYRTIAVSNGRRNEQGDTLSLQFPVHALQSATSAPFPFAILFDGTMVIYSEIEGEYKFWFTKENRVQDFPAGVGICNKDDGGQIYACSSENGLLQIYHINTDGSLNLAIEIPVPSMLEATGFRYYSHLDVILLNDADALRLWVLSAATGDILQAFENVMDAVVNGDGLLVNARRSDGIAIMETWGIQAGGFSLLDSKAIDLGENHVTGGKLTEDGKTVYLETALNKEEICFWNTVDATRLNCLELDEEYFLEGDVAFSKDGQRAAIPLIGSDPALGRYEIYDIGSGQLLVRSLDRGGAMDGVWSEDLRFIASGLHGDFRSRNTLKLFDFEDNWEVASSEN